MVLLVEKKYPVLFAQNLFYPDLIKKHVVGVVQINIELVYGIK